MTERNMPPRRVSAQFDGIVNNGVPQERGTGTPPYTNWSTSREDIGYPGIERINNHAYDLARVSDRVDELASLSMRREHDPSDPVHDELDEALNNEYDVAETLRETVHNNPLASSIRLKETGHRGSLPDDLIRSHPEWKNLSSKGWIAALSHSNSDVKDLAHGAFRDQSHLTSEDLHPLINHSDPDVRAAASLHRNATPEQKAQVALMKPGGFFK